MRRFPEAMCIVERDGQRWWSETPGGGAGWNHAPPYRYHEQPDMVAARCLVIHARTGVDCRAVPYGDYLRQAADPAPDTRDDAGCIRHGHAWQAENTRYMRDPSP